MPPGGADRTRTCVARGAGAADTGHPRAAAGPAAAAARGDPVRLAGTGMLQALPRLPSFGGRKVHSKSPFPYPRKGRQRPQQEDAEGKTVGVKLEKRLMNVAGETLKINMTAASWQP